MLATALSVGSDSVFVDLLTYSDLEALRSKRNSKSEGKLEVQHETHKGDMPSRPNTKRYLILTYAGEFDRSHYPLPLSMEAELSPATMRRVIERLRGELVTAREKIAGLGTENAALVSRLSDKGGGVEERISEMAESYERLRADFDALRNGAARARE